MEFGAYRGFELSLAFWRITVVEYIESRLLLGPTSSD